MYVYGASLFLCDCGTVCCVATVVKDSVFLALEC